MSQARSRRSGPEKFPINSNRYDVLALVKIRGTARRRQGSRGDIQPREREQRAALCGPRHKSRPISIAPFNPAEARHRSSNVAPVALANARMRESHPERACCAQREVERNRRRTRQLAAAISIMNRQAEMSSLIYRPISIPGRDPWGCAHPFCPHRAPSNPVRPRERPFHPVARLVENRRE